MVAAVQVLVGKQITLLQEVELLILEAVAEDLLVVVKLHIQVHQAGAAQE
jgi:hypothetical protein